MAAAGMTAAAADEVEWRVRFATGHVPDTVTRMASSAVVADLVAQVGPALGPGHAYVLLSSWLRWGPPPSQVMVMYCCLRGSGGAQLGQPGGCAACPQSGGPKLPSDAMHEGFRAAAR
jgi:hypothetical protein